MCKHVPRLVTFIWVGMHFCGVGTGEYQPFGSFAAFPCLNSLRLDYELFVEQSPESGVEGDLPDCEALRRYVPSTLKHFAICSIDWLTVQTICKHYLETEEAQPGFLDSLLRFIASLNIDKVFIAINMGGWLRDPPTSQPFPIKEPAIDLLRHISDTLKGLSTRFDVEYNLELPNNFTALLVEPGYTATELHYSDYVREGDSAQEIGAQAVTSVDQGMNTGN
jgi:hypothetical protein